MKACTWQRFPAALFIKLLKVVLTFDYIDDILILIHYNFALSKVKVLLLT